MPFPNLASDSHRTALHTDEGAWTYAALIELRDRIQATLDSHLRLAEPFALILTATPSCIASVLAAAAIPRPVLVLPATLPPEELHAALDAAGISLLLRSGPPPAQVTSRLGGEMDHDGLNFVRTNPPSTPHPLADLPNTPFLCQLTSGSTGASRLAVRTLPGLTAEVAAVSHALALTLADTVLVTSSLAHSYALCGGLLGALTSGACLVAAGNAGEAVALARITQPTVIFGLAATYQALLAAGDPSILARTRLALSAGAPLPAGLFDRFLAWSGIPIRQDYGTTETGTISLDLGEPAGPSTAGTPLPHLAVRLVPPVHSILRRNEQGEVLVRSEAAAPWYLETGRAISALDSDGWYHTSDAGSWDAAGRLRLGRRLRPPVFTPAGPVDLDTVEQAILAMSGVREAVAVPDQDAHGEANIRLVVVAPGLTVAALQAWSRAHLAPHEVPAAIECRDALPRSPAGKVLGKYL